MVIIYSKQQLQQIKDYKCELKAKYANRRFEDQLTTYDVIKTLERYKFKCFYCGSSLKANTWQMDHFHSRAMGGKNVTDNLCPSCKWCNQMKHALDGNAFINRCIEISINNFFTSNNLEINPEQKSLKKS